MKVVLLAGGLGTRLAPLTSSVPKPMVIVEGKPVILHLIGHCTRSGFRDFVICTHYLSHVIQDYLGDGSKFGAMIEYSVEREPLGTGGAIKNAERLITGKEFLMIYADLLMGMDLDKLVAFHREKGGIGTLTVHATDHPYDSDMLELNPDSSVRRFLGKPKPGDKFENIGNAGAYCFETSILKYFPTGKSMLDKEVLPSVLEKGERLFAYRTGEVVSDIGTHERLAKARGMEYEGSEHP